MALTVLPDVELLAVAWLQAHEEIDVHVGTEIPAGPTWPVVRVIRIGGSPAVRQWLDVARLQVDVYATTKQAAHVLARLVQAALHDLRGVHDEGVVTAVDDGVFSWNPDPETGLPSYTFDVLVYTHPNPADGGS